MYGIIDVHMYINLHIYIYIEREREREKHTFICVCISLSFSVYAALSLAVFVHFCLSLSFYIIYIHICIYKYEGSSLSMQIHSICISMLENNNHIAKELSVSNEHLQVLLFFFISPNREPQVLNIQRKFPSCVHRPITRYDVCYDIAFLHIFICIYI